MTTTNKMRVLLATMVLTAAGARAASAAQCHRVFVTSLEVRDCNEIGVCDWKVTSSLNDQQAVTLKYPVRVALLGLGARRRHRGRVG